MGLYQYFATSSSISATQALPGARFVEAEAAGAVTRSLFIDRNVFNMLMPLPAPAAAARMVRANRDTTHGTLGSRNNRVALAAGARNGPRSRKPCKAIDAHRVTSRRDPFQMMT